MRKGIYRRNLLVPALKIVLDALVVQLAVLLAYWLRFHSPLGQWLALPRWEPIPPFQMYVYFSWVVSAIFVILFGVFRSYRSRHFTTFSEDIPVILKTCFLGMLFAMSAAFLYRGFSYSRVAFFLLYLNSNVLLLLERYLFHQLKRYFLRHGFNVSRVALIGSPTLLPTVWAKLNLREQYHFQVKGYLAEEPVSEIDLPYLGPPRELSRVLEANGLDGILVAFDHEDHSRVVEVLRASEGKNLEIYYIPDVLDYLTSRMHTIELNGMPILQLKSFPLSGWQGFLKRGFDLVFSSMALLLLSPLMAAIAVMIKLTSPGPVLYRQRRVSLDGREFTMLKFRSLHYRPEDGEGLEDVRPGDDRVTPLGKFLRRTSLDELPQLINVLKGDMSLVGPRPERTFYVEQYRSQIPLFDERHRVRCGITGWAQINGKRQTVPWEERVPYDLYYIQNWSLWFDIKILLLTLLAIIRGENAL